MNDQSTNRDYPFPDSSSTALPNNPNPWGDVNRPGIPINEFAERLVALEQENVVLREELDQLRDVIRVLMAFTSQGFPILAQYYGHTTPTDETEKLWIKNIWEWAKGKGVEPIDCHLSRDGFEITPGGGI